PAQRADRGGRRGERSGPGCGRAARARTAAPAARRLSRGIGGAPLRGDSRRLPRRCNLRRAGDTHERAARHDEELDPAWIAETASLSGAMSKDDTIGPAESGDLIAAEYVLGVLSAEERRAVARRLAQEPALAAEVAFWEERLGGLADAVAPVTPPAATW